MRTLTHPAWLLCSVLAVACQGRGDGAGETASSRTATAAPAARPAIGASRARPRPVATSLLGASARGVRLQVDAPRVDVDAVALHGQLYSTFGCVGCGTTGEIGRPRLPVVRRFVEVPAGSALSVRVDPAAKLRRRLAEVGARHPVLPVQRPVEKIPGARDRAPFEIDRALYATDRLYPEQPYRASAPLWVRGHQLVMVEFYPVRYNPAAGLIETTPSAILELDFVAGAAPPRVHPVAPAPAFDAWLGRNVVNYQPQPAKGLSTQKYAEGVLVVVGNAYAADAGLAAYVEERRAEGHRVEVVPVSEIGATDTAIRSYVRAQYLAWSEPSLGYVLLVGDVGDVPAHDGTGGSGGGQATDLFYASIDPDNYADDLLAPDLIVSRISVNDATELATYLARAQKYVHAAFATDTDWLRKLSFAASCDNSSITEGTHDYVIDTYTAARGYTGTVPDDPQAGGDKLYCASGDASQETIQSALGDGRVVINFSGHGGETFWADPEFTESYLAGVLPADAAPFVISNACVTGTYDYAGEDCWGEKWLAHSAGAILFWGASNNSYWDEDDILERELWDGIFADGITRIADITHNAKLGALAHYGANDTMEYYFEMYNMLGDGTIDLYTDVPIVPTIEYPTEILLGQDQIDFTVEDGGDGVEGALVSVRGGVVQQVGYTDAAGQVTLVLDPIPDDVGTLAVTVSGHNLVRHEGSILVIPADGPYLVHESHAVTSDGSTLIAPNPGVHVVLPITLENIGSDPATGITTTLTTDSAFATISQSHPVFADIAAGATGPSTTHAELDLHDDAADRTRVALALDWSTAEGASGTSRFSVTVERPILVYRSHTVSDTGGACDHDGIVDADEPSQVSVTLENRGSGDASGLVATLSAPDCLVSDPVAVASLAAGGETTAVFTVVPQSTIACPAEDALFTLHVASAETPVSDPSTFHELLNADLVAGSFADDVEGTYPNGWSHDAVTGSEDWSYVTTSSHSPTHAWFSAGDDKVMESLLQTPTVPIGDTAELRFWHRYSTESGYDGGVLEISTDGGASFSDLGPYITSNGYTSSLSGGTNPLGGREAWSGSAAWQQVVVDLSSFGPGDVILRFRLGCDSSVATQGWWIDDLTVDTESVVCQAIDCPIGPMPPFADAGADQTVGPGALVTLDGSETIDYNGDPITYGWAQTGGTAVTLSDAAAVEPTFTAPMTAGELVFELTASDDDGSDTDAVVITVVECFDDNPCTQDLLVGDGCNFPDVEDGTECPGGTCQDGDCVAGPVDAGVDSDAGVEVDAGPGADAGAEADAGPGADAGAEPDAGDTDGGDGGCCSAQSEQPLGGTLLLALLSLAFLRRRPFAGRRPR